MSIDQVDRTVVTQEATPTGQATVRTQSRSVTRGGPEGREQARRILVLIFGLIQIIIGARIVLLLLDAREANGLVSGILSVSNLFVAPFEGILRTDALHAAGSILDVTAIVAFVGWTAIAHAAEIKIFSTRAITTVLDAVGPEFERTTGHTLNINSDVAINLVRRVEAGEPFDFLVASPSQMDGLIAKGTIVAETRTNLVRSGIGVQVMLLVAAIVAVAK